MPSSASRYAWSGEQESFQSVCFSRRCKELDHPYTKMMSHEAKGSSSHCSSAPGTIGTIRTIGTNRWTAQCSAFETNVEFALLNGVLSAAVDGGWGRCPTCSGVRGCGCDVAMWDG